MEYEHTQYGYLGLGTAVFLAVVIGSSLPETFGNDPIVGYVILASMVAIVVLTLWFSRLEVKVSSGVVTALFGFGKPNRVIQLSDVTAARQVRNRWIQGWGVRKISRGWMYNVWGLDAVELELTDGTVFRIGTDEPDKLHTVIAIQTSR
ncbi:MAG: hypothetical protein BMS9Abin12_0116 [Acidimicrobiia bacterium]|nr:MAG: hypothetical protein BMS9Abin12_0116 [Acidimicrobiia bacterium]